MVLATGSHLGQSVHLQECGPQQIVLVPKVALLLSCHRPPAGPCLVGCRLSQAPGGQPGRGTGLVGRAGQSVTLALSLPACLPSATPWCPPSTTTMPVCSTPASCPAQAWSAPACRPMRPCAPTRASVSTGGTTPTGSAVRACPSPRPAVLRARGGLWAPWGAVPSLEHTGLGGAGLGLGLGGRVGLSGWGPGATASLARHSQAPVGD